MIRPADGKTEETQKSDLLLQAALLRDQGDLEQASDLFAKAAEIEERIAREADRKQEEARALRAWYSAASAWAHAGDFHHALTLLRMLEGRQDVPHGMRERIQVFAGTVQKQREHWSKTLHELV